MHDDRAAMVALAVDAQADPERCCAYLGEGAASITADIAEVVGPDGGDWTTSTWVAVDDDRGLIGWLIAETDADMGRVWWWGPILPGAPVDEFADVSDSLFETAYGSLAEYGEHECAFDDRSVALASFADRHGFVANAASAVLATPTFDNVARTPDHGVITIDERHHRSVIALHDDVFAATHTPGAKLVATDDSHVRLVIEDDDSGRGAGLVVGYVATEMQSDGSLYIDYLGVAEDRRGEGFGRRLVAEAMRRGAASGATHAHLTVRTANESARRLYHSLGFIEQRILVPYRRGFTLD